MRECGSPPAGCYGVLFVWRQRVLGYDVRDALTMDTMVQECGVCKLAIVVKREALAVCAHTRFPHTHARTHTHAHTRTQIATWRARCDVCVDAVRFTVRWC